MEPLDIEALKEKAGKPIAWRCYDKAVDAWSVTSSSGLIESRSRYPDDWVIEPLYSEADYLAAFSELSRLRSENDGMRKALELARDCLDGEPDYHHQGMGCGLEDRNITDRYEAMEHGWDCAMERVYSEHIIGAREAISAALNEGSQS